jgi:RNA polymerase sigma factor (sigma-70 family)
VRKGQAQRGFDLNLAVMEDEALIVLAEECEYDPARDELIVRYDAQVERFIGWLAHSYHLAQADLEDARQNAIFWIVEAITKYDLEQIGKAGGCSFRSFVHRVLMSRFKDFTKHLRRVKGRFNRSTNDAIDDVAQADVDDDASDPAQIVEEREAANRLQQTLTGLDRQSGQLWRLLAEGMSLRQIAARLDLSYDSVKRRRRKLIEQLKMQLNPSISGSP